MVVKVLCVVYINFNSVLYHLQSNTFFYDFDFKFTQSRLYCSPSLSMFVDFYLVPRIQHYGDNYPKVRLHQL